MDIILKIITIVLACLFGYGIIAVCYMAIRMAFEKSEEGRDTRGCLFFHAALYGGLAIIALIGVALTKQCKGEDKSKEVKSSLYDSSDKGSNIAPDGMCFICTGGYSKRYHCDEFCKGLDNCQGELALVSEEEAEDEGRTPCQICY